ncbi:MAG: bifunctional phosphoglucose/phosphomannose isomerase [Candidatus Sungbacteria bacterium]|nr:bifunctional phosphoglucose/phosphomannose isomerase [Candidatus Sungbacteria bacterium]
MEMLEAIKKFNTQFAFEPKIVNGEGLGKFSKFLVAGMGGSHLAADLIKTWKPSLDLVVHSSYGLPELSEDVLKDRLVIASSYSGNTEETVSAFEDAGKRGLPRSAIFVGGKLKELALKDGVSFIEFPDTGIQPRTATGFMFKALLKFIGEETALKEVTSLSQQLNPETYEAIGRKLAERLRGFVPIIYASARNQAIAQNWKIKFNETGKIPAFYNIFPELNHNEMTGFDTQARIDADSTRTDADIRHKLNEPFHFVFLRDHADHPKILKRMNATAELLRGRGLPVEIIDLEGRDAFVKIFSSLLIADWAAYYTAEEYGNDPNEVPMVEEFKKLI